MVSYVNVHAVLERRRRKAKEALAASDAPSTNPPAVCSFGYISFAAAYVVGLGHLF